MAGSRFYSLCNLSAGKASSRMLVIALCRYYDADKDLFILNDDAKFTFCYLEVDLALNIENTENEVDVDLIEGDRVSNFALELKNLHYLGSKRSASWSTADLKKIICTMSVDTEENKLQFRKLMSYFIVDQFLVTSTNNKGKTRFGK
ncbi:hypothetical protein RND81_12G007900 [Saponaria officinalis]|uniref:Uncharacterized protein n=1 Tax=Saponaria officinalis TaxID=3572 RepID=A0AAW1H4W7_SAPOF